MRLCPVEDGGRSRLHAALLATAILAAASAPGCGAGSAPPGFGQVHVDIAIAGTGNGTGRIAIDYDASDPIEVFFNTCIGGTGADCDGGFVLYSSEAPEQSVWLWREKDGWLWTKSELWPYLWSQDTKDWLYLLPSKVGESAKFYDFTIEAYR